MEYYVYGWQDIDSGKMIYIGQGKNDRFSVLSNRNRLFKKYM